MLTPQEKKKVKEILSDGLGINQNINLAYFLNCINDTNQKVAELSSKLDQVISNQRYLDKKLDIILNRINRLS